MYRKTLFAYCLLATTALLVGSIFVIPSPYGVIFLLTFTPIVYYFWLKILVGKKGEEDPLSGIKKNLFGFAVCVLTAILISQATILIQKTKESTFEAKLKELANAIEKLESENKAIKTDLEKIESLENEISELKAENEAKEVILGIKDASPSAEQ